MSNKKVNNFSFNMKVVSRVKSLAEFKAMFKEVYYAGSPDQDKVMSDTYDMLFPERKKEEKVK